MTVFHKSDKIVGGRVYCNSKTMEQISHMKMADRFVNDNRVAVPGRGFVNFGFDQYFRLPGGMMNETDQKAHPILTDNEITGYRYFRHNGSWFC